MDSHSYECKYYPYAGYNRPIEYVLHGAGQWEEDDQDELLQSIYEGTFDDDPKDAKQV